MPILQKIGHAKVSAISGEVEELLSLGVVIQTHTHQGSGISPIFTTENADGSLRLILNLKKLNDHIRHVHFKMEGLKDVIHMIQPQAWMAFVDLKRAYYSVPIHKTCQKYLTFLWKGRSYEYTCLPNGYAQAPMVFTKLLKPVFACLRSQGHNSVIYMDESYLQAGSYDLCFANIHATVQLLLSLGFTINTEKSVLAPTQRLEFLGFLLDSISMTITLTEKQKENIFNLCTSLLKEKIHTVRFTASAIGVFIAALPGVKYGPLFYRSMESDKNKALCRGQGDYNSTMSFSPAALTEIQWWHDNISHVHQFIHAPAVCLTIHSDASLDGWGATEGVHTKGGPWDHTLELPRNTLELFAAKLALESLAGHIKNSHIHLKLDIQTAVTYINKKGGTHYKL